ncbi:unnamed protein product [Lampetra planeri]
MGHFVYFASEARCGQRDERNSAVDPRKPRAETRGSRRLSQEDAARNGRLPVTTSSAGLFGTESDVLLRALGAEHRTARADIHHAGERGRP